MKRMIALLCGACLMLCACGKEENPYPTKEKEPTTVATTVPATQETTEPTAEPVTEPSEETTPEQELIRHPLTGEVLDAPYSGRVAAVVINNLRDALPHYGVSQADLFFEVETEGGITRCLALFSDPGAVGTIGPVRSTRTFYNNIAQGYDAVLFHCGGSVRGRNGYGGIDGGKIGDWEHVDAVYVEAPYYFRDTDRYNYQGYSWEHTLFTTGEGIVKALEKYGYNEAREFVSGLQFSETVQPGGTGAEQVTVTFRGGKTTGFTYDAQTGLYKARQYGQDYVDAATGEQMSFSNVITLYTRQSFLHDGEYSRSYYTLTGEGEGHLAVGGEIVPICWSRGSMEEPFVFTAEDGTPITLAVGRTYIAVTSNTDTKTE